MEFRHLQGIDNAAYDSEGGMKQMKEEQSTHTLTVAKVKEKTKFLKKHKYNINNMHLNKKREKNFKENVTVGATIMFEDLRNKDMSNVIDSNSKKKQIINNNEESSVNIENGNYSNKYLSDNDVQEKENIRRHKNIECAVESKSITEKEDTFLARPVSEEENNEIFAFKDIQKFLNQKFTNDFKADNDLKSFQGVDFNRNLNLKTFNDYTIKRSNSIEIINTHGSVIQNDMFFVEINTENDNEIREEEHGRKCIETEIEYKFKGRVFSSFRENATRRRPRQYSFREDLTCEENLKESLPELNKSQYSLVSCGELTAEAVQLWLGLPEEVKYDPALAAFRQLYEKENGKDHTLRNGSGKIHRPRLPLVSSAPHLNNNLHTVTEDVAFDVKREEKGMEDQCLDNTIHQKPGRVAMAGHLVKMTLLLGCWIFFTIVFLMYNVKEEIVMNTAVVPGEVKSYHLDTTTDKLTLRIQLSGPFLSEQAERKLNSSEWESRHKMDVRLEGRDFRGNRSFGVSSKPWTLVLQEDSELDFNRGESRSSVLSLSSNVTSTSNRSYTIRLRTSTNSTTPFRLSYTLDPLDMNAGVMYSCVLLCGLYSLIIFEFINRTMAAVLISTSSLAALALAGCRPSVEEVVSWLDVETLLLLFSMMLLVAIMAETGMFDFLAVATFEITKGKLWPLISVLCAITALLSTFLDNVTTVLLMTPVTIRLCEVMDLDPVPILMSMVLYSNIGGTATPVGDPPNVIIASNKAVVQAGINFTNFTMHMTVGILLVAVQTYVQLRLMFRDTNKLRMNVPRDIQDLRHQIAIWRRAADSLPHLSKDQHIVRERLERKVIKLTAQLQTLVKESSKRACPKDTFNTTLQDMKEKYKIRDKALLIKASVALSFVVIVFFLHSVPELNRVSLGWTALLGAILLLILADREDLEPILHRVEWSTLLFFAALFVLMEALSKLGLIEFIGGLTENLILKVDESYRLAVALLLMLWVSGISSAFVDNIPLTTMMVRVVTSLGSNPNLNLPMAPLIWSLSFGACLGGNGTLIGASANVVCAGVAEQHGYKFTFVQFFKIGFPIMIGHLIVASGYLMMCHCVFEWH